MGQRSQFYINVDYRESNRHFENMTTLYFQWNDNERLVSRATSVIRYLKDLGELPSKLYEQSNLDKIARYAETDFDRHYITDTYDILKETKENDYKDIFSQDSDDGQFLVKLTEKGIKYAFIMYDENGFDLDYSKPLTAEQYMEIESRDRIGEGTWKDKLLKWDGKEAVKYTLKNMKYIDKNATLMTPEEVKEFIKKDYSKFYDTSYFKETIEEQEKLVSDKKKMLKSVEKLGLSLEYVSPELQADRKIVMEAIKNDGVALCYASQELRNDKKFILAAAKENDGCLQYIPTDLKDDIDFVLEAVKIAPENIKYASDRIKGMLEDMPKNKSLDSMLKFINKELKKNEHNDSKDKNIEVDR